MIVVTEYLEIRPNSSICLDVSHSVYVLTPSQYSSSVLNVPRNFAT